MAENARRTIAQINELIGVEHSLSETNRLKINRLEETPTNGGFRSEPASPGNMCKMAAER
jgi:hypothetical protein